MKDLSGPTSTSESTLTNVNTHPEESLIKDMLGTPETRSFSPEPTISESTLRFAKAYFREDHNALFQVISKMTSYQIYEAINYAVNWKLKTAKNG